MMDNVQINEMKERFGQLRTPFYYYDTQLLAETLAAIKSETDKREGYQLHYAVKACANPKVLQLIQQAGFGADCVSGGEIKTCLENGLKEKVCPDCEDKVTELILSLGHNWQVECKRSITECLLSKDPA